MQNFQDTSETGNWSFISAYSICITVPLKFPQHSEKQVILFCIFSGNVLYDSWVLSTNHYILSQSSIRLKEKNITCEGVHYFVKGETSFLLKINSFTQTFAGFGSDF